MNVWICHAKIYRETDANLASFHSWLGMLALILLILVEHPAAVIPSVEDCYCRQ